MKKLFATLLVALMLVSSIAALAENVYEGDLYSVAYPDGWVVLSLDTADDVTAQLTGAGVDAAVVQELVDEIQDGTVMVVSEDASMFAAFMAEDVGVAVTQELLLALTPALMSEYETSMQDAQVLDGGSTVTYGENEYVKVALSAVEGGITKTATLLLTSSGTSMYVIIFGTQNEALEQGTIDAALDEIAASFQAK